MKKSLEALAVFLAASVCGLPANAQDWQAVTGLERRIVAAVAQWPSGVNLIARCDGGIFDVMLPVVQKLDGIEIDVTYAFDDNEPATHTWNASDNGEAIFADLPTRFVRALRASESLRLTIDDGSPPRQRYELEVDGETSALVDVMEACGKPLIDARDNFPVTPPKSVVWVERPRPNPSDYPVRASSRGINGRATVSCQVQEDGRLDLCVVEGETPPRYGFGQAALKAAAHGRVTVPTDPQGGWRPTLITFTVRFDMR